MCVCACVCKKVYVPAQDFVNVYVVSPLLIHNMQFYFPSDCMDYTWVCMKPLCIYPSAWPSINKQNHSTIHHSVCNGSMPNTNMASVFYLWENGTVRQLWVRQGLDGMRPCRVCLPGETSLIDHDCQTQNHLAQIRIIQMSFSSPGTVLFFVSWRI